MLGNAGELKIVALSHCSGKATGEDYMILLCDKISKDDTEIWFFEEDESGNIIWDEEATFKKADVHHQVAIPFYTPAYKSNCEKEVYIQLRRKSDGYRGKSVKYTFLFYEDGLQHSFKRKRTEVPSTTDEFGNLQCLDKSMMIFDENEFEQCLNDLREEYVPRFIYEELEEVIPPNSSLKVDAAISDNMKELSLISTKSASACQPQSEKFYELKAKLTSFLLNREDSTFFKLLPQLLKVYDAGLNTLLHLLTMEKKCDLDLLKHIIKFAPKELVNSSNKFKMTPLHISICQGHVNAVQMLLENGANPNMKNLVGDNSIHLCVKYNQPKCLDELLKILKCGRPNFVQNINAINNHGLTALHIAVTKDFLDFTKMLIYNKALVNIPDGKSGKTALHFAFEKNSEIKNFLLSQPEIFSCAVNLGLVSNPEDKFLNQDDHPKSTECCIEITDDDLSENGVNSEFSTSESFDSDTEEPELISKETEERLCTILDSNGLWQKLGLYIMDKNELDDIAELQDTPSKIILKQFKKQHKENYAEKLKNIILNDVELRPLAKQLCDYVRQKNESW